MTDQGIPARAREYPHWTCKEHGDFDARVAVGCPECVRLMRGQLRAAHEPLSEQKSPFDSVSIKVLEWPEFPDEPPPARVPEFGGIDLALNWLSAALQCGSFQWDTDQKEAAQESFDMARAELSHLKAATRAAPPPADDAGCICKGNWRAIVKEVEHLIDSEFWDSAGNTFRFFGVVHNTDDYYYGMSTKGELRLLSCVGSLETHGYKLKSSRPTKGVRCTCKNSPFIPDADCPACSPQGEEA